ncbi:MAG: DNA adenine methylase [Deltaproteobacteria bacterium]|nr:DNA adenine methylase [Deltaproteobacteria bacterium]
MKYIIPNLPKYFRNYYEPFVGGGSVYTSIKSKKAFINDNSKELIDIYKIIKSTERNVFFNALYEIVNNWKILESITENNKLFFIKLYKKYSDNRIYILNIKNQLCEFILKHFKRLNSIFSSVFNFNADNFINEIKINLIRKIKRMKELEIKKNKLSDKDILDNIETAFKSAFYMHFRYLYNSDKKYNLNKDCSTAIFLFIRNFAYAGMFRYNSKGEFNVPYGGIGYNKKNFEKKIKYLKSDGLQQHLQNVTIENADFEIFFQKYSL